MSKHKTVAYRLTQKGGKITITALTESPRGTRVAFRQVELDAEKSDNEVFRARLAAAIEQLQSEAHAAG